MSRNDADARQATWLFIALLLATVVLEWRVLTGEEQFFLRDIGTTHRPAREVFARIGDAHVNPYSSFGQPYRGNPNLLAAYPFPRDPRWLDLQILSHLAICFVGTMLLCRVAGTSPQAAFFGASVFTFSGYVLSASSSLNAITTIAWIPWILGGSLLLSSKKMRLWASLILVPLLALFSIAGEPVLIAFTIFLAVVVSVVRREWIALLLLIAAGLIAAIVTWPVHRDTWIAAQESSRVVTGFSFERAMAASVHPARLLEPIIPYLFGNPSRIGPGAFWGYRVSRGTLPYVFSLHVSVIAIAMALFVLSRPKREDRIAIAILAGCLVTSFGGFLPGAEAIYEALPWLHVVRFPIKFFLFAVLAGCLLAARGFDRLVMNADPKAARLTIAWGMILATLFVIAAALAHAGRESLQALFVRLWWDQTWRSEASLVLGPIVESIPARLFGVAALLVITAWAAAHPGRGRQLVLQGVVLADLFILGRWLVPSVSVASLREPSSLVRAAQRLDGLLYERAGKDLNAVIHGMAGLYTANDAVQFAVAQHRQAWSLSGVRHGLRYAYDPTPDSSNTWRNELVQSQLEQLPWPERLKWLRAVGVRSVITSEKLPLADVHPVAHERTVGVPVTLYAFNDPPSEVKRAAHVLWVSSPEKALSMLRETAFRPADTVILEGKPRPLVPGGEARLVRRSADEMEILASGTGPGAVFVARSYTRHVRATVDGKPAEVLPAQAHLVAVLVPAGETVVRLSFGTD